MFHEALLFKDAQLFKEALLLKEPFLLKGENSEANQLTGARTKMAAKKEILQCPDEHHSYEEDSYDEHSD